MPRTVSELARRLNHLNGKSKGIPPLVLMTDVNRLPDPITLIAHLPAGSAIIIRHFERQQKIDLVRRLKAKCKKYKIKLLVSEDINLAKAFRLDGVHLPEKALKRFAQASKIQRPHAHFMISAACHSVRAQHWAHQAGIDFTLVSPIFLTKSHPGKQNIGVMGLCRHLRTNSVPVLGLGGISPKTAQRISHMRICGFAGVSGLV